MAIEEIVSILSRIKPWHYMHEHTDTLKKREADRKIRESPVVAAA